VTVATAVMVLLAAPVAEAEAEAEDSAADLVVPVARVAAPVVDPVLRKAHQAAPVVDRIAGIVLPDPAAMVARLVDVMAARAFAPMAFARPHRLLRRCRKSI